jgi:hypothetical protein
LNPPARAVVFSFDEKTQCQALDRTRPSLPMKSDRAGTMTHDGTNKQDSFFPAARYFGRAYSVKSTTAASAAFFCTDAMPFLA